ncbi:hypothetical protein ACR9GP_23490 [Enterobacter ludwigii]
MSGGVHGKWYGLMEAKESETHLIGLLSQNSHKPADDLAILTDITAKGAAVMMRYLVRNGEEAQSIFMYPGNAINFVAKHTY